MNKITFPLKLSMQGPAVADLQDALQVCMDRGALIAGNATQHQQFTALLKPERAVQRYGDVTSKLVATFQGEQQLQASGAVDEPTANALNVLLQGWRLLDQKTYQVAGRVASAVSASVGGVRVVTVDKGVDGDVQLAQATTDDSSP